MQQISPANSRVGVQGVLHDEFIVTRGKAHTSYDSNWREPAEGEELGNGVAEI